MWPMGLLFLYLLIIHTLRQANLRYLESNFKLKCFLSLWSWGQVFFSFQPITCWSFLLNQCKFRCTHVFKLNRLDYMLKFKLPAIKPSLLDKMLGSLASLLYNAIKTSMLQYKVFIGKQHIDLVDTINWPQNMRNVLHTRKRV